MEGGVQKNKTFEAFSTPKTKEERLIDALLVFRNSRELEFRRNGKIKISERDLTFLYAGLLHEEKKLEDKFDFSKNNLHVTPEELKDFIRKKESIFILDSKEVRVLRSRVFTPKVAPKYTPTPHTKPVKPYVEVTEPEYILINGQLVLKSETT